MKASVWYEIDEKIPPKAGYYLAFKGYSIGDNDVSVNYYYWDPKRAEWRDYESEIIGHSARVVYWTDADPSGWYEDYNMRRRDEVSVAEKDAWAVVERAVEQYEMVKALAS